MPIEINARADQLSDAPDEGDYQAFSEALSASARGRAFLAEYTRRNRNADTKQLLAAIDRLQCLVTTQAAPQTSEPIKQQLRELLDEIVTAQCELEAHILSTRAGKLAELIALVERRISDILTSLRADPAPKVEAPSPATDQPDEPAEEAERTHLVIVPLPEQPELPIPSPAATQPPPIALVRSETIMAEIAFVQPPPAPLLQPAKDAPTTIDSRANEPKISTAIETKPALPPANPLASIMALSEEERLALFT
ncbi:MAG: hypothetical protein WBC84_11870 [Pseudolabrys sp.]